MPDLKGSKTEDNLKEAFRQREPGKPPLPVLRAEGRRRRLSRRRGTLPLDRRRRDRSCVRALRLSWQSSATRSPARPSARLRRTSARPSPARPTSTAEMYPGFARTARDEGFDDVASGSRPRSRREEPRRGSTKASIRCAERGPSVSKLTSTTSAMCAHYERERDEFRKQIIELKKSGASRSGPLVTIVFENRETVRFRSRRWRGRADADRRGDPDRARHLATR